MDKHQAVAESYITEVEDALGRLPREFGDDARFLISAQQVAKKELIPKLHRAASNLGRATDSEDRDRLAYKVLALEAALHEYVGDANCSYYQANDKGDDAYRQASYVLEQLVAQFPEQQSAWISLGAVHTKLRAKAAAVTAYDKAIALDDSSGLGIEAEKRKQDLQAQRDGCYIATACYGNPEHPDVRALRGWRDEVLVRNRFGRGMIEWYCWWSPSAARQLLPYPIVQRLVRMLVLRPIIAAIRRRC